MYNLSKLPEGFSLKFGAGSRPKESISDLFFKTATSPVFPFLHIKIVSDEERNDSHVEIKVTPEIYDLFKASNRTDSLFFYFQGNAPLGQWAFDMIVAINTLGKIGIINDEETWVLKSRESMTKLIKNEKVTLAGKDKEVLEKTEEFLKAFEILDKVNKTDILFASAKEAVSQKEMNSDTIIYRLAMAMYHSNRDTEQSIIADLDDPSSLYLRLTKSQTYKKYESQLTQIMEFPIESRLGIIKVFTTFIIGAYAYHKIMGEV